MYCQLLRVLAELYYLFDLIREDVACRVIGSLLFFIGLIASCLIYRGTDSALAAILYPSFTIIGLITLVIACGYAWRRLGPYIYRKSEECDRNPR